MSDNENAVIGWDDVVSEEMATKNDLVVLPAGEYPFKVTKVERGHFDGSAKMPACGRVAVEMIFTASDGSKTYVSNNFYMTQKTLWKIYEFLVSVGLHKKGTGATRIPWDKVDQTCQGVAKLKIHKFIGKKDGEEHERNEVERFLPPNENEEAEEPEDSDEDEGY